MKSDTSQEHLTNDDSVIFSIFLGVATVAGGNRDTNNFPLLFYFIYFPLFRGGLCVVSGW